MRNFAINFQYPWLLLLLIPAFAVTLFFYLRINKRFRNTRNRITSIICHSLVMILSIFVLSGMTFSYEINNAENEIILLVDVSDTEVKVEERRDNFIREILRESSYDGYKVGVVTFGFTQVYAVPLTYDVDEIYHAYKEAPLPDTSATNIAAALNFAYQQLEHPESSKIILITDGKETDESATSVVLPIAKRGTVVDTVLISEDFDDNVQVTGVEYPDYHVNVGEEFTLSVNLRCKNPAPKTTIEITDNGMPLGSESNKDLSAGEQSLTFKTSFADRGLHEIKVTLTGDSSELTNNNSYCSYYYLDVFGKILIIEQQDGESAALKAMLEEEESGVYSDPNTGGVTVINIKNVDSVPETVDELRQYDQIILNNISNADLQSVPQPQSNDNGKEEDKDWFVRLLYSYVDEYGGGLFTIGGMGYNDKDELVPHAYNREDMYGSLYQQILPVQAVDYVPPVGVMIIIDVSGSMGSGEDGTPLYYAKEGAVACLESLNDGDYVGIMTLDDVYGTILPLTRRTEEDRIKAAIQKISGGGGTLYSDAIQRAGESLRRQKDVDKRHIVLVSDGVPSADDKEKYEARALDLYRTSGITISFVGVDMAVGDDNYANMKELTDMAGGQIHVASGSELIKEMRADLSASTLKEFTNEKFYPLVEDELSPLLRDVEYGTVDQFDRRKLSVQLDGFFGVKKRESADMILKGEYEAPIYAQWKFGKGMVGSFMCDLSGNAQSWSTDFMKDSSGRQFLYNVIANLMPTENIRPSEVRLNLIEDNYTNRLNIFTELENGQYLTGKIVSMNNGMEYSMVFDQDEPPTGDRIYFTTYLGPDNNFSRCNFVIKDAGVYELIVTKYNADGTERATVNMYKAFSYSEEYDFPEEDDAELSAMLLANIADRGNGIVIPEDDPDGIFDSFIPTLQKTYDPRLLFIIIAMVLFLLDIAVRKFKFKWIHELVREHRQKKAGNK